MNQELSAESVPGPEWGVEYCSTSPDAISHGSDRAAAEQVVKRGGCRHLVTRDDPADPWVRVVHFWHPDLLHPIHPDATPGTDDLRAVNCDACITELIGAVRTAKTRVLSPGATS